MEWGNAGEANDIGPKWVQEVDAGTKAILKLKKRLEYHNHEHEHIIVIPR